MRRLIWLCALLPALAQAGDRQSRLERGEVLIRTVKVDDSGMPEARVEAVLDAPPAAVFEVVSNCDKLEERMPRMERSRSLGREGGESLCETTVDMPFPIRNLTAVTRSRLVEGPPLWSKKWKLVRGDFRTNDGMWEVRAWQDDPKRSHVHYRIHAVPELAVPDFLQRFAQKKSLPDVMANVEKQARKLGQR